MLFCVNMPTNQDINSILRYKCNNLACACIFINFQVTIGLKIISINVNIKLLEKKLAHIKQIYNEFEQNCVDYL